MENNYGKVNLSVGFKPTSAFPIDIRVHFDDSETMYDTVNANEGPKETGSFDSLYYFGQLITLSFENHTKSDAYLVVKNEEKRNLLKLTNEDETKALDEKIIKIGKAIDFTGVSTGLFINDAGKLAIKLTNQSGLHIKDDAETGEKGLEIKIDNGGNVKLEKTNNGLKATYSWDEW